jgi:hypothetical protein
LRPWSVAVAVEVAVEVEVGVEVGVDLAFSDGILGDPFLDRFFRRPVSGAVVVQGPLAGALPRVANARGLPTHPARRLAFRER